MRKKKSNLAVNLIVMFAIFIVAVFAIHFLSKPFDKNDYEIANHFVSSGDTLWNIGKELVNENDDIREWIYEVKKLNNRKSDRLRAGDSIMVYVKKEK